MDLYSASRRFNRPYRFDGPSSRQRLPLSARGLVGDGNTAALITLDGCIDWLCMPKFDSPSVFGAILDPEQGGRCSLGPASYPFESMQAYDPDTNVLETLHTVEGQGVVRVTDFMPWADDPREAMHEVHRRVECREGNVEMEVVFDPRFDYGSRRPEFDVGEHGVVARAGTHTMAAVVSRPSRWEPHVQGGVATRFRLRAGEHAWLVLSWDAPTAEPPSAYRPFDHLRITRQHWRDWTRRLQYDGPYRHHVVRSALALKLLIYAPSGAMVAAPTTSLPEWIGGTRNWDYRFTWTRDTAMAIRAANRLGFMREAREFFHFVRDSLGHEPRLQVMYSIDGRRVPPEQELGHLAGFGSSVPVRIGNGARDQQQLDTTGALIDAAFLYEQSGGTLTLRVWRHLRRVIDELASDWRNPDHGIWEPRSGVVHNVHSKLMSWIALQRGHRLAGRFGDVTRAEAWSAMADQVRHDILANGLSADGRHFVSAYGGQRVDAALLLLSVERFLPPDDPRILATIEAVRQELGAGPFLYRYRTEDGVGGPEGAFVLCGFWLAQALARAGRVDEAQEVFTAHAESSNHLGLLAEEIDPDSGVLLGNFPQAFSHLGLINAAIEIDRALRLRDEGPSLTEETA